MNDIKVRVGFSTSKRLVSRIVRWFTKSKASHAFLCIDDSFLGVDMIMQATKGGFQMMTYDTFDRKYEIVKVVDLNHPVQAGILKAAKWLGTRYDYTGLFGSAFVIIGRWLKRNWTNPWDSSKALFCSEVVVKILQESNYPGADSLDASATNPQDLLEFLTKE